MELCSAPGPWQAAVLGAALIELILSLSVFLTETTFAGGRTVSANLFDLLYFRIALSVLVYLRILVCCSFCNMYRLVERKRVSLSNLAVCAAAAGWGMVVGFDPVASSIPHTVGAALYIVGMCGTYFFMLVLAYRHDQDSFIVYDLASTVLFLAALVFTLVYVGLFFSVPDAAWLWENIGFTATIVGHIFFFWYHQFDPTVTLESDAIAYPAAVDPLLEY